MIESPTILIAIITLTAALAFWLDHRFRALSKVGSALMAIFLGALLSNLGVVAPSSAVYDGIAGPVTSLAIAWLVLAVDLRDLRKAGGRMLGAYGLAVTGTAVGAAVAGVVFAGSFADDTWRLAGTMAGSYAGGAVNFVAVGRGVGLSSELFAGTLAADAVNTAIWMAVTLSVPLWLKRFFPAPIPGEGQEGEETEEHPFFGRSSLSALDLAVLLAVAFVLLAAAEVVSARTPAIPSVLWLTTFALAAGQLPMFRRPAGALQLGNLALHLFFVVIGIACQIGQILIVGVEIFFFVLLVLFVHGLVVFGVGRLVGLDLGTLAVGSQAAIGGPPTAMAVAVAWKWERLVLPGILVGLLGYALGNYLGFGVAYALRGFGLGL
jgi:uncharacterized membrane protein